MIVPANPPQPADGCITGVFYKKYQAYFAVFRFYADGTVISASIGDMEDLANYWPRISRWFQHNYNEHGPYLLTGSQLEFSTTAPTGTVEYHGQYLGDRLILSSYSHINQHHSTDEEYLRLEGVSAEDE